MCLGEPDSGIAFYNWSTLTLGKRYGLDLHDTQSLHFVLVRFLKPPKLRDGRSKPVAVCQRFSLPARPRHWKERAADLTATSTGHFTESTISATTMATE